MFLSLLLIMFLEILPSMELILIVEMLKFKLIPYGLKVWNDLCIIFYTPNPKT